MTQVGSFSKWWSTIILTSVIWAWYFSSLLLAFSSDTSSCFWFSPMADNSSSMVTTRLSAFFTLSSARRSSSSIIANDRARLSYFISFSEAILRASLVFLSKPSSSTSLFMVLDSHSLIPFTILSASFDMWASFKIVLASFSTEMLLSVSMRTHRRHWAFTSSSLSRNSFSAISYLESEAWSFSIISSKLHSYFCTFFERSRISASSLSLVAFASFATLVKFEQRWYRSSVSAFIDCIFFLIASIVG